MKQSKKLILVGAFFASMALSTSSANAGALIESIAKTGPVHTMQHRHILAAKNFCLMHVDSFVKAAKLKEEDYVKLAYLCSHAQFHDVWKLTGGGDHQLTHYGYEAVHKWEADVRNAAVHVMKGNVPSEEWRNKITTIARKVK